jgi:hypothetical protein
MLLAATLVASLALAAEPCWGTDEDGSSYRTCFEPGEALEIGLGGARRFDDGASAPNAFSARWAIRWRNGRTSRSKPESDWLFEHRLLDGGAQFQPWTGSRERRELSGVLYEGLFQRHVRDGFILIPSRSPVRLPFPFDVAARLTLGGYQRRVQEGPGYRLDVLKTALLLDPLRSDDGRRRLAVGIEGAYTFRHDGTDIEHELSPFTSGVLDLAVESDDGAWVARFQGVMGWVVMTGGEGRWRGSAEARLERLVLAVNDRPLWI